MMSTFGATSGCDAKRRFSAISATWYIALLTLAALAVGNRANVANAEPRLVTHEQAARHGLERAWFAQVPVDASRSRVTSWYIYRDGMYAVTNSGIVAALNAETGQLLWARQVGKPGYPAFGPGANDEFLGIVSGSKLYILDRHDGRLMWSRSLGSAPSSGPALSEKYAFVALITGRIEGYNLEDPVTQPWYYQSKGRTFLRPTTTGRIVSWPTTEGYLYVSRANEPGVLFRLETSADIVTSPAHLDPYLYIASQDGYLYCMHQLTGVERWRYSTGYSIDSSPAIVGTQAYVASVEPAIHALDAQTGQLLWMVPGVSHFAAQGKERVYTSDSFGNLIILDAKTGTPLSRMPIADGQSTLVNDQTDRIFLVSSGGLVQCLREVGATQPTLYRPPLAPGSEASPSTLEAGTGASAPPEAEATEDAPMEEPPAADEVNPFGIGADEMEADAPAVDADDSPAEEPSEDVNPFEDF